MHVFFMLKRASRFSARIKVLRSVALESSFERRLRAERVARGCGVVRLPCCGKMSDTRRSGEAQAKLLSSRVRVLSACTGFSGREIGPKTP